MGLSPANSFRLWLELPQLHLDPFLLEEKLQRGDAVPAPPRFIPNVLIITASPRPGDGKQTMGNKYVRSPPEQRFGNLTWGCRGARSEIFTIYKDNDPNPVSPLWDPSGRKFTAPK